MIVKLKENLRGRLSRTRASHAADQDLPSSETVLLYSQWKKQSQKYLWLLYSN